MDIPHRPRSSSIPRNYTRMPRPDDQFDVVKAGALCLKLRAIDGLLHSAPSWHRLVLDFAAIIRSDTTTQSVADTEVLDHLPVLLARMRRPDLIPDTFVDLYTTVLKGRIYRNENRCSDFRKGPDPTCSEVLRILPVIDHQLGTSLSAFFNAMNDAVKPFPLLELPAELRLQIYSHLLPRANYLSLFGQPSRASRPPRLNLVDILRTSHQLHGEVTEYFYNNQTLLMKVVCPGPKRTCEDYWQRSHDTLAGMNPRTRQLFKQLEIQMDLLLAAHPAYPGLPESTFYRGVIESPIFAAMLKMLPNLEAVIISFSSNVRMGAARRDRADLWVRDALHWLIGQIPESLQLRWDFYCWSKADLGPELKEKLAPRGEIQEVKCPSRPDRPSRGAQPSLYQISSGP
ncbi:hypothetical protein K458DRAFT_183571 [Lentithecium fluviatile CBS 122367]|uniref:F-box domain-containing protein n=1 Tax=Lentithecium fluviatile CBS 122367 TaxID=1168545 RepID=A0A6G1IDQ0_9PLEO|nr:hypothetical protein K458DRAFT_183571 [Lentithecium fluviatile CBS 122367]